MDNGKWVLYWRLSATSTLTNQNFFALGLPPPSLPDFKPYTEILPQSQGGAGEQGYQNITILWDRMDFLQIKVVSDIIAALTNGVIYATVDRAHGFGLINDFIDISGQCLPLQFEPISQARGVVFENVRLTINNLVILADPSSVL